MNEFIAIMVALELLIVFKYFLDIRNIQKNLDSNPAVISVYKHKELSMKESGLLTVFIAGVAFLIGFKDLLVVLFYALMFTIAVFQFGRHTSDIILYENGLMIEKHFFKWCDIEHVCKDTDSTIVLRSKRLLLKELRSPHVISVDEAIKEIEKYTA